MGKSLLEVEEKATPTAHDYSWNAPPGKFAHVSVGEHTCFLDAKGGVHCYGYFDAGSAAGQLTLQSFAAGQQSTSARGPEHTQDPNATIATLVLGGTRGRYVQLSVGPTRVCALGWTEHRRLSCAVLGLTSASVREALEVPKTGDGDEYLWQASFVMHVSVNSDRSARDEPGCGVYPSSSNLACNSLSYAAKQYSRPGVVFSVDTTAGSLVLSTAASFSSYFSVVRAAPGKTSFAVHCLEGVLACLVASGTGTHVFVEQIVLDTSAVASASLMHVSSGAYLSANSATVEYGLIDANPVFFAGAQSTLVLHALVALHNSNRGLVGASGGLLSAVESTVVLTDSVVRFNRFTGGASAVRLIASRAFISNSDLSDNVGQTFGGVFLISVGSSVAVVNSTCSRNSADDGACAYVPDASTLLLSRSRLEGNVAKHRGGAIRTTGGVILLAGTALVNNSASLLGGGALHLADDAVLSSSNALLRNNFAAFAQGGAIAAEESHVFMRASTVTGNHGARVGGALALYRSSLSLTDGEFADNYVLSDQGSPASRERDVVRGGGAVGFQSDWFGLCRVRNVTFRNNSADNGGALLVAGEFVLAYVTRATFTRNHANQGK